MSLLLQQSSCCWVFGILYLGLVQREREQLRVLTTSHHQRNAGLLLLPHKSLPIPRRSLYPIRDSPPPKPDAMIQFAANPLVI
uniref:Uncharacterized protein n=1 Tax=Leersia perrieri TaxID=77586 RepID=A0A0D9WUC9_9ORYZ